MPRGEIRKGDEKTVLVFVVKDQDDDIVDISTCTTKEVIFTKPGGEKVTEETDFTVDGKDGKMQFVVTPDWLDVAGDWKCQGYVVFPGGGTWKSDIRSFRVHDNL